VTERELENKVITFRDLINNLLGSCTSSERIDARRELVGAYRQVLDELQVARRTTPDRESIIEECAKVCDEAASRRWYAEDKAYEGCEFCAEEIRALKTAPNGDEK